MTIKLVELYDASGTGSAYRLREVYINPEYVVAIRPDEYVKVLSETKRLPEGLDPRQSYTKIFLNKTGPGSEVVVVGEANSIHEKLFANSKKLIRG